MNPVSKKGKECAMDSAMKEQGFKAVKAVDDVYVPGPGRPMTGRTAELYTELSRAIRTGLADKTLEIALADDEMGKNDTGKNRFYRFSQRCRTAASKLGIDVRVAKSPNNSKVGLVRVLEYKR